jgi:hypothetical protein
MMSVTIPAMASVWRRNWYQASFQSDRGGRIMSAVAAMGIFLTFAVVATMRT